MSENNIGENKLWRYYDVLKFLTLINGELYFARADKFKDKYEGAIPKQNYLHFAELYNSSVHGSNEISHGRNCEGNHYRNDVRKEFLEKFSERKRKAAISCWHLNDSESAAMWEVYSRAGQGIAVCTTLEKLKRVKKPDGYEMEMFKVDYIDFNETFDEGYINYELLPFKNKRKEFEYEHEFRIMLYKRNKAAELVYLPEEGIKLGINTAELIDGIIASPDMAEYEVSEIQKILDMINKLNGTEFTIKRSGLYENLHY